MSNTVCTVIFLSQDEMAVLVVCAVSCSVIHYFTLCSCRSLVSLCTILYCWMQITHICVDFGDGADFFSWMPVYIGVSRSLTGCVMYSVMVPRFGWDMFGSRIHLLQSLSLCVPRAESVNCCSGMSDFCVLWVLVDGR